jgi:periplasmic protein TonB
MFEDSLVESSGRLTPRHPWTTVFSFAVQIAICGSVLLLSLIYTESLPTQRWINILQAPPPPASAPTPLRELTSTLKGNATQNVIVVPREIPKSIFILHEETGHIDKPLGIAGGVPDGNLYGITTMLRSAEPVAPKLTTPSKVRVSSGVAQGLLIRQVNPQYPQMARLARIEGRVILQATIGKDGTVQNLHLISGHPMLVQAAIDAVKQWLYKPYYLNGEPVEVDTTINVNFTLTP